ncbi:hypothetical protein CEXT_755991 [Caerostris extrusa]|uniref:Uncharacterized protein n=1 Tax=Caerostris extrusa TaxID=172846 RepID=A0AAV4R1Q2_CAEEX|nr:hypothetical protein CEXT_755991 [Caerostris extrusa]
MFRFKVTRNCKEKQITWPDDAKHAARNVFAVAYDNYTTSNVKEWKYTSIPKENVVAFRNAYAPNSPTEQWTFKVMWFYG